MARRKQAERKARHAPREVPAKSTRWTRIKNNPLFLLGLVAVFAVVVIAGIIGLSALLSGR